MHLVDDYFVFDGTNSLDCGIQMQGFMTFSSPTPRVETVSVPGRNGDLHFYDGSFDNRIGSARCFALRESVDVAIDQINKWLLAGPGYKRLEVSTEPETYRMARISSGPETEIRANLLAPFSLTFDCMPQKFFKFGEEIITMTSPGTIYNVGFSALPVITVYGAGSAALNVSGTIVQINSISDYVTLDSDTQNAYKGTLNKNSTILAARFPIFRPGKNEISWSGGITKIEITPRWWTL